LDELLDLGERYPDKGVPLLLLELEEGAIEMVSVTIQAKSSGNCRSQEVEEDETNDEKVLFKSDHFFA